LLLNTWREEPHIPFLLIPSLPVTRAYFKCCSWLLTVESNSQGLSCEVLWNSPHRPTSQLAAPDYLGISEWSINVTTEVLIKGRQNSWRERDGIDNEA
jgi:hypothetical protein